MNLLKKGQIAKGAEAIIYRGTFLQDPIAIKHRLPKAYRHPDIDNRIRLHRLRSEAKVMTSARKIGVSVPCLMGIDIQNHILILESLEGKILFEKMDSLPTEKLQPIFLKIGRQIGLLHSNDIIHGDLTVFNVLIQLEEKPSLIDFGLGKISNEVEAKADDILTFYSTLKAIQPASKILFSKFLEGYLSVYPEGKNTYEQMKKIQSRARYIAREDRLE
ncbi:MAG: KEOPS complex kinase/ATPase Bud32 [Candidatus Hodarchaeales archaeon]